MKKIAYYLIVGLAITALEAKTVEAQGADPNMPPPTGEPGLPPAGDPNMPPPTGDSAAKPTILERAKRFLGIGTENPTPTGDPNMPPPTGEPGGPPPAGG